MSEDRNICVLRYMAWERAKGELHSMLQTYYNEEDKYDIMKEAIENFIKDVEDNGKQE